MTDVSSRVRRGFSLIELLTVLGILVVLAAILLPVCSKARETARQVMCASSMRQLAQATFSYAADNNGYLPQPNHSQIESQAPFPIGWLYAPPILSAPADMTRPDAQAETGSLWPYLKSHGVYHCPDDTDPPYPLVPPSNSSPSAHYLTSYMMNCAVVGFDGDPGAAVQQALFYAYPLRRMSPQGVLFWEGAETPGNEGQNTWNDGCDAPNEGISYRHSGGSQVALFNGSVQWLSQAQIQQGIGQMPGQFWCAPGVANGN